MNIEKRWVVNQADPETVLQIASAIGISEHMAKFLVRRGHKSADAALSFINADVDLLGNPFEMVDMEKAVNRLLLAKQRGEKVHVAGDRDTDGVTSTTLLVNLLQLEGVDYSWKVPTQEDGYGLSLAAVEAGIRNKANLIISVDCEIRDFEGVDAPAEAGIEVVI
ncbi:MAG: single-stranded-DNA-specific exonuclease RecJ, partial [Candidatus Lindowbacteria bacterium]|nr:single-stranded-DNA-specific exonuclease RecJ [Candidatus Lindowbacteria bacterium]